MTEDHTVDIQDLLDDIARDIALSASPAFRAKLTDALRGAESDDGPSGYHPTGQDPSGQQEPSGEARDNVIPFPTRPEVSE